MKLQVTQTQPIPARGLFEEMFLEVRDRMFYSFSTLRTNSVASTKRYSIKLITFK